jgi:hypothetical protein
MNENDRRMRFLRARIEQRAREGYVAVVEGDLFFGVVGPRGLVEERSCLRLRCPRIGQPCCLRRVFRRRQFYRRYLLRGRSET